MKTFCMEEVLERLRRARRAERDYALAAQMQRDGSFEAVLARLASLRGLVQPSGGAQTRAAACPAANFAQIARAGV